MEQQLQQKGRHREIMCNLHFLVSLFILKLSCHLAISTSIDGGNFMNCLSLHKPSIPVPIYSPDNSSYFTIFNSSARNLRFLSPTSPKPQFIVTPLLESHVQAIVLCCRQYGLDLKIRSGGHDVEGLSYVSEIPFVVADFANYRNITVDVEDKSAWIQAGAQIGEVYYRIAEQTKTLGFPAGICPTVGVGGHFSGRGLGTLVRKYGLSSDQVIDARLVNVKGEILNKDSMGDDLFWAIRGGGASSFGVILSWKVRLVPVTPNVTVSSFNIMLEENATSVVYKWQEVAANKLHEDLYIAFAVSIINSTHVGNKTVQFTFNILFLGYTDELLHLMHESLPELGLQRKDCIQMTWAESHVYFYAPGSPLELLLDRDPITKSFLKIKSDYVKEPISEVGLQRIWKKFVEGADGLVMFWTPLGGRMNEITEFETPYPHRAGYLYNILYTQTWLEEKETKEDLDWIREFYSYMGPYVSMFPRAAYLNYKDLDLGENKDGVYNSILAKRWGSKYFKSNFERLVYVKSKVDPGNFFKNKQSIPPY